VVGTSIFETADGLRHLLGDVALFADVSMQGRPDYIRYDEQPQLVAMSEFG
jgi:hypothetical protein